MPILETRIERVPVDRYLTQHLSRWKGWRLEGWDVTVLVTLDSTSVVVLACRVDPLGGQQQLL